jgi:hypothetical protein
MFKLPAKPRTLTFGQHRDVRPRPIFSIACMATACKSQHVIIDLMLSVRAK